MDSPKVHPIGRTHPVASLQAGNPPLEPYERGANPSIESLVPV
jgi:hypothetical protein